MARIIHASSDACLNVGGRPVHPAITATEALVEAIAAIDCDRAAFEHFAQANLAIARQMHERAERLAKIVRPEILRGYAAAETLVKKRVA